MRHYRIGRAALSIACVLMAFSTMSNAKDTRLGPVKVEGGLVAGVPSDTEGITAFLGVPFAGNVGGDNRWRPAPPVKPWEGIHLADTPGPKMFQDHDPEGNEIANDDGLVLNIWTPSQGADENLPVYMLIHGGANRTGSAQYDDLQAAELASHGLIVVSVQYRLGPFGFMALPEMAEENPQGAVGNYAILDLVDALEWIRDNIDGFGGDPETVTIGGQSAGAENTVALLRSPLAEGLFDRAVISSSFTGFLPGKTMAVEAKMKNNQAAVDELFGRPMTLAELREIPDETWLAPFNGSDRSLYRLLSNATASNQFYTIDGHSFTEDSVDLLQPGDFGGLDIMIGQTADERTSLGGDPDGEMTPEEYRQAVLDLATARPYMVGWENEEVFDLYVPMTDLDAYRLHIRMQNDRMFQYVRLGAEFAKAHSEDADIWLWYWDHAPPGDNEGFRGAYHAADIYYFNASLREDDPNQRPWTDPDLAMRDLASGYLANFVKTGDPNGEGLPEWGQVTAETGGQFIRFHQGEAKMRTQTLYPSRDAYHRKMVLEGLGKAENDIFGQ
ncbi:carboxylesterase/lipase family protein [Paracoccus saliphilus]|uniref:carboxylesterase/lipase family protein n=1 Tax=Paracoccus saliphilus TaxID=405559 RepID=UPI0026575331|nr:carboxylesterase family protein [Paracoccus saliphilus]